LQELSGLLFFGPPCTKTRRLQYKWRDCSPCYSDKNCIQNVSKCLTGISGRPDTNGPVSKYIVKLKRVQLLLMKLRLRATGWYSINLPWRDMEGWVDLSQSSETILAFWCLYTYTIWPQGNTQPSPNTSKHKHLAFTSMP